MSYASRGARRGLRWSVYHTVPVSVAAAAVMAFLFVWWEQSQQICDRTEARQTTLVTTIQSLRAQIALFKLQHNDRLPGVSPLVETGGPPRANQAVFWAQMTQYTDVDGHTSGFKSQTYRYGPYFSSISANRLNGSRTIASAPAPGVGFVYDFSGGAGSGKIWGVDDSGTLVRQ